MTIAELAQGQWLPSYTQEGMWLFERTYPGTAAQNVALTTRVQGPLDPRALAASVQQVLGRHPGLLSGLREEGGEPRVSAAGAPPELEQTACHGPEALAAQLRERVNRPFHLDHPPLLRTALIRAGPEEHHLLLVSHRAAADWSALSRLAAEIWRHYGGRAGEEPGPDYRAFAHRQRREMDTAPFQDQAAAYAQELADAPAVTELPGSQSSPTQRTFRGASLRDELSADEADALLETPLAQTGEGPQVVLFAALAELLGHYTGQEEAVIGWTVNPEVDNPEGRPLGPLENRLPVRVPIDPERAFRDQVATTRRAMDAAWAKRHLPFELLLRRAPLPRNLARPPLIQVLFEYRVETTGSARWPDGLSLHQEEIPPDATALDLHLVVTRRATGLHLLLRFNPDVIDGDGANRLLANFKALLDAGLAQPDTPSGRLDWLSSAEFRKVVYAFNRTEAPYPADTPLHELVRQQAHQRPEAPAYLFEGRQVSYREVDAWSETIAHRLMTEGVGKGAFVPLLMDRSLELPVAMLGVLKTGAAFVPMDVHWPAERIADIVADSGAPMVLVTHAETARTLLPRGSNWATIDVDELSPSPAPVADDAGPDDPIYMIYTSGSTGKPKGAINRHRGIVNRLTYMTRRYGFSREDVVLQTSAHIFDAAVWQYFWPLINGGPAVLPSPMVGFDYDHISCLIERYRVTVTDFVPSVFNLLVDLMDRDPAMRERLRSLRQVLIGGEALSPDPAFRFRNHLPQVGITNTYGPTETSIGVIFHEVGDRYEDPLPIGRPIDNVHTYILDAYNKPVPIGVTGRLHVGGECVGLGYHRNPAKTTEAFIANPFPAIHPGPIYNTGDLARYRADGTIDFLGRSDHQVKIRGVRIELGEIEGRLAAHPDLQSAVVAVWEPEDGGKRLVAYVVPQSDAAPTAQDLRAFLKQSLPEYMLPNAFMQLEELPLMRSGKVDRQALPQPAPESAADEAQGVPPSSPTEQVIADVWKAELGLDRVSVHDNFFEIGGDSLGVVRVAAELEYRAGLRVEAEQMMIQTLGQLAASADGASAAQPAETPHSAPERPGVEPFFLGSGPDRLFACLHPPARPIEATRTVVFCPALGHEYLFTHRALRSLAERLARAGLPALRFDYPGTGDSAGDPRTLRLEDCVQATTRAVSALRDQHPGSEVVLVGLRLGGTVAARAARAIEGLAGLVLWDPVADGSAHLQELAELHRGWLGGKAPVFGVDEAGYEVADLVGWPLNRALYDDLRGLTADDFPIPAGVPSLVIDSTQTGQHGGLPERAAREGRPLAYRHIPYPEIWNQDPYKTQLPHEVLAAAEAWTREPRHE